MVTEQLKRLDLKSGSTMFSANGKTYHIESSMSIERYTLFQKFELELGYGISFKQLFDTLNETYALLNQGKLADASVKIYNAMMGFGKLEQKEPHVLKYCALFINADGEDRKVITDDMITQKIEDWQQEGYAIQDFFSLALNSIPSFIESYRSALPDTLAKK